MTSWGILAPDTVISLRRQQNLGLGAAVRHFNDRAVPGLGGMWFPMPILWSVLAVSIAEELGRPALPIGNAVEALMMRDAVQDRTMDRRVRGTRKMQDMKDWSFRNLTRRGTYVVQPIRMAMVQPLVALGFVHGSRYGAFRIDEAGRKMLELPVMDDCRKVLRNWARGGRAVSPQALSPVGTVPPEVRKLIIARLQDGTDAAAVRRRNLIELGAGPSAGQLESPDPLSYIDPAHWTDLRAGAAFMDLRDAALAVLDRIEQGLMRLRDDNQPVRLSPQDAAWDAEIQIERLRCLAKEKGDRIYDGAEPTSRAFLAEIRNSEDPELLQKLAARDGTAVALRDGHLCLGPAAGGIRTDDDPDAEVSPPNDGGFAPQLFRLFNLHCLATELGGKPNPGCRSLQNEQAA